jgi:hypothetical protein
MSVRSNASDVQVVPGGRALSEAERERKQNDRPWLRLEALR